MKDSRPSSGKSRPQQPQELNRSGQRFYEAPPPLSSADKVAGRLDLLQSSMEVLIEASQRQHEQSVRLWERQHKQSL